MVETLKTSTCATCGGEVVYMTTTSSGLWYHTKSNPTAPLHHQPNPISLLPKKA